MAKCCLCKIRKGKRECIAMASFICTQCCGIWRTEEKCKGCFSFRTEKKRRNYNSTPQFSLKVMSDDFDLQDSANVIESAICQFDVEQDRGIDDHNALRIMELLLDKYHFNDTVLDFTSGLEEAGFRLVDDAIRGELGTLSTENLSRIIATIYHSIKRRTAGRREYLEFIHNYVGVRIGEGIRVMRVSDHGM